MAPDEHAPLTAAEVEAIRAGLAETQAEMRAYPPGLNAHAQAVNRVGAFNATVATTYAFNVMPRLLATLDAYREIARAVARGAVSSDAGGHYRACLYCSWAVNDYDSDPEHDADCAIMRARRLLGEEAP